MKFMLFTYRDSNIQLDPEQRATIPAAVAAWCAAADRLIVDLRVGGGSLEDVYLELVGRRRDVES